MKIQNFIAVFMIFVFCMTANDSRAQECISPDLEYYMANTVYSSCTSLGLGEVFTNPVDGSDWEIYAVDDAGNVIHPVEPGVPFYLLITWTGQWGVGYMPHLYIPGNYHGILMTWYESWLGGPAYTGSAEGEIVDLADIAYKDPTSVSDPNLVVKTPGFASASGDNTLIVLQEQVFPGWWGGPWIEPDSEIITWILGPFSVEGFEEFTLRILMSPAWNEQLYVADYMISVTPCLDNDNDGYFQETIGCTGPFDCDDQNPAVNPAACDIKKDGIDQDCDGVDSLNGKQCSPDDIDIPAEAEGPGKTCSDSIDNDGDGFMDCNDPDCFQKKSCR